MSRLPVVRSLTCGLVAALVSFSTLLAEEEKPLRLAVVNVSFVFENYKKVADIQRHVDDRFKVRREEIEKKGIEILERNDAMDKVDPNQLDRLDVFDAVQKLRREKFLYDRELKLMNEQVRVDYLKEMKEVLNDIRTAIRLVAETDKYDVVVRSPDSDNPAILPAGSKPDDAATQLQLREPKNAEGYRERFMRNPVLFSAQTTDITDAVLKRLNEEYIRRSLTGGKPEKK